MLRPELIAEIDKITSYDDCSKASKLLRVRMEELRRETAREFRIGQTVTFESKKVGGIPLIGTIQKINKKTMSVYVEKGRQGYPERWTVDPTLLTPVTDEPKKASKVTA